MNSLSLFKLSKQQTLTLMLIATGITCTTVFYGFSVLSPAREPVRATAPRIEQISALGRLKPVSEVVKVSVPAMLNHDRVAKLLVQRGDRVNVKRTLHRSAPVAPPVAETPNCWVSIPRAASRSAQPTASSNGHKPCIYPDARRTSSPVTRCPHSRLCRFENARVQP